MQLVASTGLLPVRVSLITRIKRTVGIHELPPVRTFQMESNSLLQATTPPLFVFTSNLVLVTASLTCNLCAEVFRALVVSRNGCCACLQKRLLLKQQPCHSSCVHKGDLGVV